MQGRRRDLSKGRSKRQWMSIGQQCPAGRKSPGPDDDKRCKGQTLTGAPPATGSQGPKDPQKMKRKFTAAWSSAVGDLIDGCCTSRAIDLSWMSLSKGNSQRVGLDSLVTHQTRRGVFLHLPIRSLPMMSLLRSESGARGNRDERDLGDGGRLHDLHRQQRWRITPLFAPRTTCRSPCSPASREPGGFAYDSLGIISRLTASTPATWASAEKGPTPHLRGHARE
jgi:hypothetical protein